MAILRAVGLKVAYRRQISGSGGPHEPTQIVLVIRLTRVTDFRQVLRSRMVRVGRRQVVIERVVMGAVGRFGRAVDAVGGGGADRFAIDHGRRGETALEPSHEMPRAVSNVPMFWLVLFRPTTSVLLQSSNAGSGSPITLPAMTSSFALFLLVVGSTPPVMPETTLMAPTVEGPKLVP